MNWKKSLVFRHTYLRSRLRAATFFARVGEWRRYSFSSLFLRCVGARVARLSLSLLGFAEEERKRIIIVKSFKVSREKRRTFGFGIRVFDAREARAI